MLPLPKVSPRIVALVLSHFGFFVKMPPNWFVYKKKLERRQRLGRKFKSTEAELAAIAAASDKPVTVIPSEQVQNKPPGRRWMTRGN